MSGTQDEIEGSDFSMSSSESLGAAPEGDPPGGPQPDEPQPVEPQPDTPHPDDPGTDPVSPDNPPPSEHPDLDPTPDPEKGDPDDDGEDGDGEDVPRSPRALKGEPGASHAPPSTSDPKDPDPSDPQPDTPHPDDPGTDPVSPDEPPPSENPDLDPTPDPEREDPGETEDDEPLSPRAGVDPIFERGGVSLGDGEPASEPTSERAPDSKETDSKETGLKGTGSKGTGSKLPDNTPTTRGSEAPVPPGTRKGALDRTEIDPTGAPMVGRRIATDAMAAAAAAAESDIGEGAEESEVASAAAPSEGDATASIPEDEETFRPDLETFSGPFGLLLYLIHKDEVDIFDIPISSILTQFLARVRRLEATGRLDLQESGEYLVMAARLMEIKSRMLLPNDADEEEDLLEAEVEDPRWSLVRQLLEYREIKERANLLEAAHRNRSQCFERIPGNLPTPDAGTLELKETSSLDLRAAFQRVLDLLRERDAVRVVPGEEIPIEIAMAGIREQLFAIPERQRPFSELFPVELGLRGLISYFMALLELTRLRHLRLEQPDDYGDILVILREAA